MCVYYCVLFRYIKAILISCLAPTQLAARGLSTSDMGTMMHEVVFDLATIRDAPAHGEL